LHVGRVYLDEEPVRRARLDVRISTHHRGEPADGPNCRCRHDVSIEHRETGTAISLRTNEANAVAGTQRHSREVNDRRAADRHYLLAPGATLPMLEGLLLDELRAFILPVAAPVVVPFFTCVLLVVLLVAPGPTFPSLDAPGAG